MIDHLLQCLFVESVNSLDDLVVVVHQLLGVEFGFDRHVHRDVVHVLQRCWIARHAVKEEGGQIRRES